VHRSGDAEADGNSAEIPNASDSGENATDPRPMNTDQLREALITLEKGWTMLGDWIATYGTRSVVDGFEPTERMDRIFRVIADAIHQSTGDTRLLIAYRLRDEVEEAFLAELAARVAPRPRGGRAPSTWAEVATELDVPRSTLYERYRDAIDQVPGYGGLK